MKDEYIKRSTAVQCARDVANDFKNEGFVAEAGGADTVGDWLQDFPAGEDVRPVILCRDCKHNMANIPDIQDGININENWNACQLTELYDSVNPDDFCSRGKRKEEN